MFAEDVMKATRALCQHFGRVLARQRHRIKDCLMLLDFLLYFENYSASIEPQKNCPSKWKHTVLYTRSFECGFQLLPGI